MSKRIHSSDALSILTWEQADELLLEINQVNRELERIEGLYQNRVEKAKTDYREKKAPYEENKNQLINSVEVFFRHQLSTLKRARSPKLNHGTIGVRKSSMLRLPRNAVAKLKDLERSDLIRVKESPNKEAIRLESEDFLKELGAKVQVKEEFFIEPPDGLVTPGE